MELSVCTNLTASTRPGAYEARGSIVYQDKLPPVNPDLERLMAEHDFYLTDTGGGLESYTRQETDGTVTIITRAEDAEAPESIEDPCTVGRLVPEGESELIGHADDVRVALLLADRQSRPNPSDAT